MLRGSALPLNKRIPLSYTGSYRRARSPADNRKTESTKSNTQPVYGADKSKSISIERTTESTNEEPNSTTQYTSIPSSLSSLTKTSAKSTESPVGTSIIQTEPLSEYPEKYIPSNPTRSEPAMDSNEKHDQTSSTPVSMITPSNLPPSTSSDTPSIPETMPKSTESRDGALTNQTEMLSETQGQNTPSIPTQSEHPMETEQYDQTSTSIPLSTIAQNNILPSTSSDTPSIAETSARTAGSPNLTSTAQTERTTILSEPPGKVTFASLEKSLINEPSTIYSLVSTYGSSSASGTMSEPFGESTEIPDLDSVFETQPTMQSMESPASNPTDTPSIKEPSPIYSSESTDEYPSDTGMMSELFGESTERPDFASVFETQPTIQSTESPASNPTDTPSINEPSPIYSSESTNEYPSGTGMMLTIVKQNFNEIHRKSSSEIHF
ncbi:cell wall protein DAN4-like [Drosophila guanche]|uniref:cell wall protein DAN4-like n=1 Tax=Drosophila guanche TaxID=7266 RepID=UPI0014720B98|nr:cell wall protein DAN4-like [Drosophila guanche]